MKSTEVWFYIRNGMLYKHIENDGYAFMRNGPEEKDLCLCSIEEAEVKYPTELNKARGITNAVY